METDQNKLNEQLLAAAANGDIDQAIAALTAGADLNAKTYKGNNSLYIAAIKGQREMFDWLLEVEQKGKKLDVDNQNNFGNSIIMEMIKEYNFSEYIEKLLKKGANPDIGNAQGINPLIQACSEKKVAEVQLLLEYNANPNYVVKDSKNTPFLTSALNGSLTLCEILIEYGADVNALDGRGKNALLSAFYKQDRFMKKQEKKEHEALCLFLLDSGIDIDYVAPSGMSAFWVASMMRKTKLINVMLEKNVNVDVWHEVGMEGKTSALHMWCQFGSAEIVAQLLDRGAKLGVPDESGNLAESYGLLREDLRDLMLEKGANPNALLYVKNTDGKMDRTPLISALISRGDKSEEFIGKMIDHGAKVTFSEPDLQRAEPIFAAISASAVKIFKRLLDTNQIDVNQMIRLNPRSKDEFSPLSFLVSGVNNEKFNAFLTQRKLYQNLMKAKETNEKNGVVSDIISEKDFAKIEEELKQGEKFEEFLEQNQKEMFDTLLTNNADVNLANSLGRTSLFYATNEKYLTWLKDAGADLFLKDNDGNDVLSWAVMNNRELVISALKQDFEMAGHTTAKSIFYQMAFIDADSQYYLSSAEKGLVNYLGGEEVAKQIYAKKEEQVEKYIAPNIDYQDEDGNTALIVATANNIGRLASFFLKVGANINHANKAGETAIMHAIATENDQLVEILIERGADLNACTLEGKSVLDFAEELNNRKILEKVKVGLGHEMTEGMISGVKKFRA